MSRCDVPLRRVRVVGSPGSGKTTTARAIANALGVPHLELDAVHWLAGWAERDPDEFRQLVAEFATGDGWVIDGNYGGRLGDRLDHLVDTYVWLDLPRWRTTLVVIRRTVGRGLTGEDLWASGNRERVSSLLRRDPTQNLAIWAWTNHHAQRERYEQLQRSGRHRWIRLRSRREISRFIADLETGGPVH